MATADSTASPIAPPLHASLERLRGALLWLTGLSGAFVFMEPSPYEVASLLAMIVFALTGLTLRSAIMPMVLLLVICNIGFSIAVIPGSASSRRPLIWVIVSWYLATTAIFFAAMLGRQHRAARLTLLISGYTIAARRRLARRHRRLLSASSRVCPTCSCVFGRARGTFNDPNVLGAFLVFPALIALQRALSGRMGDMLRGGALLQLFVLALLLSFSRAAWGQFALLRGAADALTFITSHSTKGAHAHRRDRGPRRGWCWRCCSSALLSIDAVAALCSSSAPASIRATTAGHTGRFGRHALGFMLALDKSVRDRAVAVRQDISRGSAQFLSERLHVGRLDQRLRLCCPHDP